MTALLLDSLYLALCAVLSPWLLYRRVVLKKSLAGFRQKLSGAIGVRTSDAPCAWFHAVSVGEVLQLQTLIARFLTQHPGWAVVISTTTGTGFEVARAKFPAHQVVYWPWDFSWAVNRALSQIRPSLVVLVELEIWPGFLQAAQRRQVPVMVINGRLSRRSWSTYRRFRSLLKPVFTRLRHVAAQTEEYAERFRGLGVPAERVSVTGNIKYDGVSSRRDQPATQTLREAFRLRGDELVWIAGSTQDPEERLALAAYRALKPEIPQLRLLVVPRHKERFEEVAQLIESQGFSLLRRSCPAPSDRPDDSVLLLDTLGELGACWGLADIAFVGGSLTQRGGQNMLEPAAYGAAVLFGPNTWNFRDIVQELLSRQAAEVVQDGTELQAAVRRLARDLSARQHLGQSAQRFVLSQQGATAATLQQISAVAPVVRTRRVA